MSEIDYQVEEKGDIYILRMNGTINTQTLPKYREIVDNLMKELDVVHKDHLKFIVDYGGIDDVDSSAVANILDRLKNSVRSDHKVVFINVPQKFKSLVDIFKMGDSIKMYDSQKDAEEYLSS